VTITLGDVGYLAQKIHRQFPELARTDYLSQLADAAVAAERERASALLIAVLGNYRSPEMELVIVAIRDGLTVDELRARVEGGR
jgi:hypothetical protein